MVFVHDAFVETFVALGVVIIVVVVVVVIATFAFAAAFGIEVREVLANIILV